MDQIPLPSPIHYELILQLLEKQTMSAANQNPSLRSEVNQLIITMRKAASQQKRLEQIFNAAGMEVEYRWSINHYNREQEIENNYQDQQNQKISNNLSYERNSEV